MVKILSAVIPQPSVSRDQKLFIEAVKEQRRMFSNSAVVRWAIELLMRNPDKVSVPRREYGKHTSLLTNISVTPEMLFWIDSYRAKHGVSRAAIVRMAINLLRQELLEKE